MSFPFFHTQHNSEKRHTEIAYITHGIWGVKRHDKKKKISILSKGSEKISI
jgi:hypothetical protein